MIDQNIGNPEITRKHLSELQTFYEAQLVAKRHYDALMTSLKPLRDAADVLRASGVVNVDALLSQPVSATKAMIDEMEAEADDDELNDLTPHDGEEEDDPQAYAETLMANAAEMGVDEADEKHLEAQPVEQEAEPDPAPESVPEPIEAKPHVEDAISEIEAQAETTSTETMEAQPLGFDLPEGAVKNGIGYDQYTGWYADYTVPETGAAGRVYATEGGAGDFQLDLNSHSEPSEDDTTQSMQAIAQAVEAVDAEPEAATEQPETVEVEPETPAEPKAERKTLDCTDDFTQEEILAQSGATAPAVQNQPDDIAATERAEFDAPQRQFYNPWAKTAKAEG